MITLKRNMESVSHSIQRHGEGRFRAVLVLGSAAAILLVAELGIRLLGTYDENGNFLFLDRRVHPYKLPLVTVRKSVERYLSAAESSVFDPILGWTPRPQFTSYHGLHRNNRQGIRAEIEYSAKPEGGRIRIALFGDSFTYAHEVPWQSSWGYVLEQRLRAAGIDAEVMNFGVGEYGMDQALLRWKEHGREFAPRWVLFGFHAENSKRNLNMFRPLLYYGSRNAFSKPRFVLEGKELRLVNVPCIPPQDLVASLEQLAGGEHERYEFYYDPADYLVRFWNKSRLASWALDVLRANRMNYLRREREFYRPEGMPSRLTGRILDEFQRDVVRSGGRFMVIHLVNDEGILALLAGKKLVYFELLEELGHRFELIDPHQDLLEAARKSSAEALFEPFRHYSPEANRVIAESIAGQFLERRSSLSELGADSPGTILD